MKFCVKTFLDHYEEQGSSALPPNWEAILADLDGRSTRYGTTPRKRGPKGRKQNESDVPKVPIPDDGPR